MWLLNAATYELQTFEGSNTPKYAILSHRWEDGEVSFKDMQKGRYHQMKGFYKIEACCRQAIKDDLKYAWVDTCCIDKRSSAELSEAINSMYTWYERATVCYAYLSDISAPLRTAAESSGGHHFTTSVWFTRGWTLQELLAPSKLIFYDRAWEPIGSRSDECASIQRRTGICPRALIQFDPKHYCIAERMSWAANRVTARVEDRAYSLLGIFDVNMPLLYGEGKRAFRRLQESIMAVSNDLSIFIWSRDPDPAFSMIAEGPDSFSGEIVWVQESGRAKIHPKPVSLFQDVSGLYHGQDVKFTASKHGVEGKFNLLPYVYNIYLIRLGSFLMGMEGVSERQDSLAVYMFVELDSSRQEYRRVFVDGHSCVLVRGRDTPVVQNQSQYEIAKYPIERASSNEFDRSQLERFLFGGGMTLSDKSKPVFVAAGTLHGACSYDPESPFERIRFSEPKAKAETTTKPCICLWYNTGDLTLTPSIVVHITFTFDQRPVLVFTEPLSPNRTEESKHQCDHEGSKGHFRWAKGCVTIRTERIRSSKRELRIHPSSRGGKRAKMQPAFQGWSRDPYHDFKPTHSIKVAGLGGVSVYEQPQKVYLLWRFSSYVPGVEMLPYEWATYPAMTTQDGEPDAQLLYNHFYSTELTLSG